MSDPILVNVDAGVMTITFNRPEKKNAITSAMYATMADALGRAETDPAIKVVLFEAEGSAYSAGNDMADFAVQNSGAAKDTGEIRPVTRFLRALAMAKTPLVAAVGGLAVGVGTTMLLHCDLVYGAADARLTTPFVNLALVPEAASSLLLPALVGHQKASAMFMLGEPLDAVTAEKVGLFHSVYPTVDDAKAAARKAAALLATKASSALRATKELMRDGQALSALMDREGMIFGRQLQGPEVREAISAFFEKRPADFSKVG
jgi:enoyl-CoA hydratase/carnithine racemase